MIDEFETKVRGSQGQILIAEDDPVTSAVLRATLERAGYEVRAVSNGTQALASVHAGVPDLIISDIKMPEMDGFELLRRLRADQHTRGVPLILITSLDSTAEIILGLELGADDYLTKPIIPQILLARVRSKLQRPPVPVDIATRFGGAGFASPRLFNADLRDAIETARAEGTPACIAAIAFLEWEALVRRLGDAAGASALRSIADEVHARIGARAIATRDEQGRILILFRETGATEAKRRVESITRALPDHRFMAGREPVRLSPFSGFSVLAGDLSVAQNLERVETALDVASGQFDLRTVMFAPEMDLPPGEREAKRRSKRALRWTARLQLARQLFYAGVGGIIVPFVAYWLMDRYAYDVTGIAYLGVVAALVLTALFIWTEGVLALPRRDPPLEPAIPYPPASAIIAAYLPNEAATIVETVESFLRLDYPASLQIVLAYNTPHPLPVEQTLARMAAEHPSLVLLKVEGSTSKAQNVNAALGMVTGEFTGVFDADHHPEALNFRRAWRWLADSADVVQGHCVIRNIDDSWVSKTVAVEFEAIYAVSHPGRARLHGFGIFGGSNGYWKTELLRRTRMHGTMLTEDIDSSMRAVGRGARIMSDPHLISRELGPVTLEALWHQRLRWAQGWFQVTNRRFLSLMASRELSLRQKLGLFHLLLWRELFPWLSMQVVPIMAVWLLVHRPIELWVPIFVFTSLFTLSTGPAQAVFIAWLAVPEIRGRPWLIVRYAVISLLFYAGLKNLIARLAQIKELSGERAWKVTPRG